MYRPIYLKCDVIIGCFFMLTISHWKGIKYNGILQTEFDLRLEAPL